MKDVQPSSILKTHLLQFSRRWVFLLVGISLFSGLGAQGDSEQEIPAEWKQSVSSLNDIMFSIYDVISGPAGQERDWDKFRYLCKPEARLIPIFPDRNEAKKQVVRVHSVDEFAEKSAEFTKEHGFFELETYREVQSYGGLTHVWSHYEGRAELNGEPIVRGINSIQLFYDGDRWWVMGIFWQPESPDLPMPEVER